MTLWFRRNRIFFKEEEVLVPKIVEHTKLTFWASMLGGKVVEIAIIWLYNSLYSLI